MNEREVESTAEVLTQLVDFIYNLTAEFPQSFSSEDHNIDFLQCAVIGFDWEKIPASNDDPNRLSFTAFINYLHSSISLETELKEGFQPTF